VLICVSPHSSICSPKLEVRARSVARTRATTPEKASVGRPSAGGGWVDFGHAGCGLALQERVWPAGPLLGLGQREELGQRIEGPLRAVLFPGGSTFLAARGSIMAGVRRPLEPYHGSISEVAAVFGSNEVVGRWVMSSPPVVAGRVAVRSLPLDLGAETSFGEGLADLARRG
jgi:hypothetical protein